MNFHRIKAYLLLILVSIIWGVASCVIKFALTELPPFNFLLYRFFLSAVILVPILIASNQKLPSGKKDLLMLGIIGFLASTVNLGLLFAGLNLTSVLDESIISNISPILVIMTGAFFLKERITKKEKIGIGITLIGTILIIIQPILDGGGISKGNLIGNILVFLGTLAWVAYLILSKKALQEKIKPLVITTVSFVVGLITVIPLAFWESGGAKTTINLISNLSISSHMSVIYMAIISGALAYFLYSKAQKTIEASEAVLFSYLKPVFALPLAVIWLGEKITLPFIVGSVIVILGVAIAEVKKLALPKGKLN